MGGIDLDPASSERANEFISAAKWYGKEEEDGLAQTWRGRVWCNPPFSTGLVGRFVKKLSDEYMAECVTEYCFLTNNASETKWGQDLLRISKAVCMVAVRMKFWHPD